MREEKISESNKEKRERPQVLSEREYVDTGVKYALSTGWVKEQEKDTLVEEYLKPIYRKYLEIIEELKGEQVSEDELSKIILRLNNCLEATRRIGSTDPNNIVRSIDDSSKRARDTYTEHALTALLEFVTEILNK